MNKAGEIGDDEEEDALKDELDEVEESLAYHNKGPLK